MRSLYLKSLIVPKRHDASSRPTPPTFGEMKGPQWGIDILLHFVTVPEISYKILDKEATIE